MWRIQAKGSLSALVLALFVVTNTACAGTLYEGTSASRVPDSWLYSRIHAGQVLIVSEQHGLEPHHQNQRDILSQLSKLGLPVSVGMEFFEYPDQRYVDEFVSGSLEEADFLKLAKWGKFPFDNYRFQVQFPRDRGGKTVALNLPRALSTKVKAGGLESLTEDEKKILPPNFEMGRQSYYERFHEVMKDHATEEQMPRYFTAQSLWDETMAWQASDFLKKNPNQLLVIIVGDFHVAYQDGLVARLRARGVSDIVSVSQVDTREFTAQERAEILQPHERYGARADFVYDVR